jgi:hypothetical protein
MKKTAPAAQHGLGSIAERIARLEEGRRCAEQRLEELSKLQSALKAQLHECTIPERRELITDSLESVDSLFTMQKKWIPELNTEIERVTQASRALATDDTEVLRSAFEEFVLSDTAHSVINITMALYDFDQFIASTKRLVSNL